MTTVLIPLYDRRGVVVGQAMCDEDDRSRVEPYRWRLMNGVYAAATVDGRQTLMHRLILDAPKGLVVDHINRDGLDNRRSNIRLCTVAENNQNVAVRPTSKTGIRGVSVESDGYGGRRILAKVVVNGRLHRKRFPTIEEAAEAARAWRRELLPFSTH